MKSRLHRSGIVHVVVAPARGRGLKFSCGWSGRLIVRRPREGAWIEIYLSGDWYLFQFVAPARGRGLKSILGGKNNFCPRRPREGAWIEI